MNIILSAQNLLKKFGNLHAVDGLSFEVKKNSITGLLGPNGAGKTTAFNLITHFLPRNGGHIFFRGKNIHSTRVHSLVRMGMARTFQQVKLFSKLTVRENILLALSHKNDIWWRSFWPKDEKKLNADVLSLLKKVQLEKFIDETAENLSYGQAKLVEILRCIATGSEMILLDEPASGINSAVLEVVKKLILDLKAEGKTILIIEHNMPFIMGLADEIVVMENGKFLCQDVPAKIQKNPKVLEAYLGKS